MLLLLVQVVETKVELAVTLYSTLLLRSAVVVVMALVAVVVVGIGTVLAVLEQLLRDTVVHQAIHLLLTVAPTLEVAVVALVAEAEAEVVQAVAVAEAELLSLFQVVL
jgi:hypothetical protein